MGYLRKDDNPNVSALQTRYSGVINIACYLKKDGTCDATESIKQLDDLIKTQKEKFAAGIPTLQVRQPTAEDPNSRTFDENFKNPFEGWGSYKDTGLIKADQIGNMVAPSESDKVKGVLDGFFVSYVGHDNGQYPDYEKVNEKVTELKNALSSMEKFYSVYTGKNSSIKPGQDNYKKLIEELDNLVLKTERYPEGKLAGLGKELADKVLNIAEDNIEQYHIYNHIPQDEEVQAYIKERKNKGFLQPPVGSFNTDYYFRNSEEATREGLAMLGRELEKDEEGNPVLDANGNVKTFSANVKDLYKIARYADSIEDYAGGADRMQSSAATNFANDHYISRVTDSNGNLTNDYYNIRVNEPVADKNQMLYRGVGNKLDTRQKQELAKGFFDISALPEYETKEVFDNEGNLISVKTDTQLDPGFDAREYYINRGVDEEVIDDLLITDEAETTVSAAENIVAENVGNVVGKYLGQFEALTRDSLQKTIEAMKLQSQKEAATAMLGGIGTIKGLQTFGADIAEQIVGGFNIGGFNPLQGAFDELEDRLKTDFEKFSPFSQSKNNVIYNWQKWFGETFNDAYDSQYSFNELLDQAITDDSYLLDEQSVFQRKIIESVGNHFQNKKSTLFGSPRDVLNDSELSNVEREEKDILQDAFYQKGSPESNEEKALRTIALLSVEGKLISEELGEKTFEEIVDEKLTNSTKDEILKSIFLKTNENQDLTEMGMGGIAKTHTGTTSPEQLLNKLGLSQQKFDAANLENKFLHLTLKNKLNNNAYKLTQPSSTYKGAENWFGESNIDDNLKKILQVVFKGNKPEGTNVNSFTFSTYEAPVQNWSFYKMTIDPASSEYGPLTYGNNSSANWYVQLPKDTQVSNAIGQFYEPAKITTGTSNEITFNLKDEFRFKEIEALNNLQLPVFLKVNRPDIAKSLSRDEKEALGVEWGEKIFNNNILNELGYDTSTQQAIVNSSRALSAEIRKLGSGRNMSGDILHDVITGETIDYLTKRKYGFSGGLARDAIENLQILFNKVEGGNLGTLGKPTYQYIDPNVLSDLGYGSFEDKKDLEIATNNLLKDLKDQGGNLDLIESIEEQGDFNIQNIINLIDPLYIENGDYEKLINEINAYQSFGNTVTYSPKALETLGFDVATYGDYTQSLSALKEVSEAADSLLKAEFGNLNAERLKNIFGITSLNGKIPNFSPEEMQDRINDVFNLNIDFDDRPKTIYNPEILKAAGFTEDVYGDFNDENNLYTASEAFKNSLKNTTDGKKIKLKDLLDKIQKDPIEGNGELDINDVKDILNSSEYGYRIDLLDKGYEMYNPDFLIDMGYLVVPEDQTEDYSFTPEEIYQASLIFEEDIYQTLGSDKANELFNIIDNTDAKKGVREAINYTNNVFGTDINPLTLEQFIIGDTAIDYEFAQNFIQEFLEPRFDYSESMDEFMSYMEVDEANKNILQKIDTLTLAREKTASLLIDYTEKLKTYGELAKEFNYEFYMDPLATDKGYPLINEDSKSILEDQARKIQEDYESFKESFANTPEETPNISWGDIAYQFGINPYEALNNPEIFAQLHYQAIGQKRGYLGTSFAATEVDIKNYLETELKNELNKILTAQGSLPFGRFERVEDYVDDYLDSIVLNEAAYEQILKALGFLEENQTLEDADEILLGDVRNEFIELLRTVPASSIRAQIEQLEKVKDDPTQANLGVFYIPREDVFNDYVTLDENGEPIELSGEENYLSEVLSKIGGDERDRLVQHLGYEETPDNEQLKADLLKVLQMQNNWETRELKRDLDDLAQKTNTLLSDKLVVPTDKELQDYLNRTKEKEEGPKSVFYEMFKNAGYAGDEDTFYEELFPDADRSEMDLFSKILRGEEDGGGFKLDLVSKMQNPWSAISFAESLASDDYADDESTPSPFSFLDKYSSGYSIMDEEKDQKTGFEGLFDLDLDDEDNKESTSTRDPFIDNFMSLFS